MNNRRRRTTTTQRLRIQSQSSHGVPFGNEKPLKASGCRKCRIQHEMKEPLQEAAQRLQEKLDQALAAPDTISTADLAAYVSALALARLAQPEKPETVTEVSESSESVTHGMPIAESVVDYPADEFEHDTTATEDFIWRRELEMLWRKHITKDEFHRPVVRSLGLPVLVIVDHVRAGRSWKSICENYPGLVHDDIRAAVSMATECGWVDQD